MQNKVIGVISKRRFRVIDHTIGLSPRKVFNIKFTKLLRTFLLGYFLLFVEDYFHYYLQSLLGLLFVIVPIGYGCAKLRVSRTFVPYVPHVPYVPTCFTCFTCSRALRAFIFLRALSAFSLLRALRAFSFLRALRVLIILHALLTHIFLRALGALHAFIFLRA